MQSSKPSILLAEDEENLHEALKLNLELEGYEVTSAYTGSTTLQKVQQEYFDLLILDVMLPDIDGISITETIRVQNNDVPILILSAKNTGADKVLGLKKGADDYLTKPFNLEELLLRVQKLIKRHPRNDELQRVEFANCVINFSTFEATAADGTVHVLSKREMGLLYMLTSASGNVVSRDEIIGKLWDHDENPSLRTIDNFILGFRKLFEKNPKDPQHFHTIRGVGYRFTP